MQKMLMKCTNRKINAQGGSQTGISPRGVETPPRSIPLSVLDHGTGALEILRAYIDGSVGLKLCRWCQYNEESIRTILESHVEVVLVDSPPRNGDAPNCVGELKHFRPKLVVIVLAVEPDLSGCIRLFQSGADGYYLMPGTIETLTETIQSAIKGWKPIPREIQKQLIDRLICGIFVNGPGQRLTKSKREVMVHFSLGHIDKEIADELGKTTGTIHSITNSIFKKLRVHKRAEAVRICLGFGSGLSEQCARREGPITGVKLCGDSIAP